MSSESIVQHEYVCECGIKCRVDWEHTLIGTPPEFRHCSKDKTHSMGGPIIATWEERDGVWVPTGKYR